MRAVSLACGLVGVSLLLVLPAVWGLESESEQAFATIALERLAIEETPKSLNAYQFLRADTKGHVYLLKGDTLQVDELLPTGKLVARGKPVAGGGKASDSPAFTDAMLSPDGSSWLLASRPERLALLNSDGLRDLPSVPWLLSAVVYGMDGPIVSVIPSRTGTENASAPPAGKDWNRPPLLLELKDQEWKTLVAAEPFVARDQRPLKIQEMKAERDTRLAVDARGTLWVAQQDAYLLRHYSRSGILLDSLRAGDGRVQWQERTAEDWNRLETVAQADGVKLNRAGLANVQAARVVRGMTTHDDKVYLVVETSAGLALDRWDPKTSVLDRTLLPALRLSAAPVCLVGGKYGLYLAGGHVGEPVWYSDWDKLDSVKWKPVPNSVHQVGKLAA